jgi:hypothetical protein
MKRDMELVRLLLLRTEGGEEIESLNKYDQATRAYHAAIMKEAGLIDATILDDVNGLPYGAIILRLTWDGHEFLDSIRDNTLWKKASEKFFKPGVAFTVGIAREWIKLELRQRFLGPGTEHMLA